MPLGREMKTARNVWTRYGPSVLQAGVYATCSPLLNSGPQIFGVGPWAYTFAVIQPPHRLVRVGVEGVQRWRPYNPDLRQDRITSQ